MATGIRDKVAVIGMGCTRFGERWDSGAEELMVEAFIECLEDAGIDPKEIQAAWFSTCLEEINVGKSALALSITLRLPFIPVTRTENYCASGTEAFRGAVYAVASGAYDLCLVMGVKNPVTVKALQLALSNGEEMAYNDWDGSYFMTTNRCSIEAYQEAGITNPRKEISMMELHDCFSITELVTYEDMHISDRGNAWQDVLEGFYNRDGKMPCQVDGGLKCFGHPIGASGLRMLYEMYLQLLGRAGERQIENPRYGLTHNLGGFPAQNICSISIIGRYE